MLEALQSSTMTGMLLRKKNLRLSLRTPRTPKAAQQQLPSLISLGCLLDTTPQVSAFG